MPPRGVSASRRSGFFGLLLLPVALLGAETRLLTPAELPALDRENRLWSLVRPEADVAANVAAWRRAGIPEPEITAFAPRLAALWDVEPRRAFGWMHQESIERIREVDQAYTVRMRAARLYAATGMRAGRNPPETDRRVTLAWRRALWWRLELQDYREFWMMNSPGAQNLLWCARHVGLSDDEARTLCDWQREFDYTYGAMREPGFNGPRHFALREEARWTMHGHFRAVLGDERFAEFLAEAEPDFREMRRALEPAAEVGARAVLDLWWLKRKNRLARTNVGSAERLDRIAEEARAAAAALLGEEGLALYAESEDGRWLRVPVRGSRRKVPIDPALLPQRSIPTG